MSTSADAQPAKEDIKDAQPSIPVDNAADASKSTATSVGDKPKLSGAELKKQKQAEKAARRAKVIEKKVEAGGVGASGNGAGATTAKGKENGTTTTPVDGGAEKSRGKPEHTGSDDKIRTSSDGKHKQGGAQQQSQPQSSSKQKKEVQLWSHLPERKQPGPSFGSKEDMKVIHQDVQALGLQMQAYIVCGSNSRLIALLTVLKTVIKEYTTPEKQALTRHLIPQVLNPQIGHLAACRPLSVSQGNAIRWLKLQISKIDVNTPEDEAKEFLCTSIDEFIRDKSTLAHKLIAEKAAQKIKDGDVVLTFAKSVVVEKTIKKAWADGKRFRLIIIDSQPWSEGKKLAESLVKDNDLKEMRIAFGAYFSVSHYIDQATKVFLGAHAMMSNGCLYSRVGTAGVALEAHTTKVPVIVLCESVKFSDKAPLNTYDMNEIAPVGEMFPKSKREAEIDVFSKPPEDSDEGHRILKGIEDVKGMKAVNLMYDLTPAAWIDMVISEHGAVPPTSVPVLNRLHNEANEG